MLNNGPVHFSVGAVDVRITPGDAKPVLDTVLEEKLRTLRDEKEKLENELRSLRHEVASLLSEKSRLEVKIEDLLSERDAIQLKVEAMLDAITIIEPDVAEALGR